MRTMRSAQRIGLYAFKVNLEAFTMHFAPSAPATAGQVLDVVRPQFPGAQIDTLPDNHEEFRIRVESARGPIAILIPRSKIADFESIHPSERRRAAAELQAFVARRLRSSRLNPDVVAVWDYAE